MMNDVDRLVSRLDPGLRPTANKLRELVNKTLPESHEVVKWNNPVWIVNGKNTICVMCYKDHLNLGFFNGAFLKSRLLEGTGKGLRHIKVKGVEDIIEKQEEIIRVIRASAETPFR